MHGKRSTRKQVRVGNVFSQQLSALRVARGLTQRQLAELLHVERSTITRWEAGTRMPDASSIPQIAAALGVSSSVLLDVAQAGEPAHVIVVDDEKVALHGCAGVVRRVLPGMNVVEFTRPSEALAFVHKHPVAIAFLDIEMGHVSGLDLCRSLLELSPITNVIFLTAHSEYSFDAWSTGACGYLLKPVTIDAMREQLGRLRHPVAGIVTHTQAPGGRTAL